MRYIGIDYGEKRVGIALSDETGEYAFSKEVIKNSSGLVKEVVTICNKEGVVSVVVGESKDYKGEKNPIMKRILPFVEQLKKEGLNVILEPEFMTSTQAAYFQGNIEKLDASSAAIILQSFLDKQKR
jgi:putative Holliday junction resolvase